MSTGVTTNYALPFPYGDDPLANGDDMIQRLAEKIDALIYERFLESRMMYLSALRFPNQIIQKDVATYPKGPFIHETHTGGSYGGVTMPVPHVDTTNGLIYIPESGNYEIEWRQTFNPSAAGVDNTNQIWVAGWRDNTARGRDQYARGHLASEVPGTSDPAMVGGTLTVPLAAGQWVRSITLVRGGKQSVGGFVRVCGPFSRVTAT